MVHMDQEPIQAPLVLKDLRVPLSPHANKILPPRQSEKHHSSSNFYFAGVASAMTLLLHQMQAQCLHWLFSTGKLSEKSKPRESQPRLKLTALQL